MEISVNVNIQVVYAADQEFFSLALISFILL